QPRARHAVVDVAVHVHVDRVRAAGHQVAADEDGEDEAPARATGHEHRRDGRDEEERNDSRLRECYEIADERARAGGNGKLCHARTAPAGIVSAVVSSVPVFERAGPAARRARYASRKQLSQMPTPVASCNDLRIGGRWSSTIEDAMISCSTTMPSAIV